MMMMIDPTLGFSFCRLCATSVNILSSSSLYCHYKVLKSLPQNINNDESFPAGITAQPFKLQQIIPAVTVVF
jgi:hypothetical protein